MRVPDYQSWAGVLSGMIVWAVWFVVIYALAGIGCDAGWQTRAVPGGNQLSLILLASSATALVIIGWCARRGYVGWRRSQAAETGGIERQQRLQLMGLAMFVLSLLAAAGTVMISIPVLMLDPCAF